MTKTDEQELQFLRDSVTTAKAARQQYMNEVRAGWRESNFMELRQLDMDIQTCENELRRSYNAD